MSAVPQRGGRRGSLQRRSRWMWARKTPPRGLASRLSSRHTPTGPLGSSSCDTMDPMPSASSTERSAGRTPSHGRDGAFFLRRIERLVRVLLRGRFDGAQELWRLQLGILDLQRDIQRAIATTKQNRARSATAREDLLSLRRARWHARTLGDTFAWLLLGQDRKVLHAFAHNSRGGIQQDDHGARGLVAVSAHLASEGWGFPLLHDITDCLRVGDVTFIRPQAHGDQLKTFEVKTRIVRERASMQGRAGYEYQVSLLSPLPPDHGSSPRDREQAEVTTGQESQGRRERSTNLSRRRNERRVERQLRRMANAIARREAPDARPIELEGEPPLISVGVESSSSSHWPSLRSVIRSARSHGYASSCVDGTHLYAAYYDTNGVTEEMIRNSSLIEDLTASHMFPPEEAERNSLVVYRVPPEERDGLNLCLPYFLYSIPKRAIFDVLQGRLVIVVLTNPARMMAALEKDGFRVSAPLGQNPLAPGRLVVTADVTDGSGQTYRVELHNLPFHINEIIYEFKSIDYLLEVARSMRDATIVAIGKGA